MFHFYLNKKETIQADAKEKETEREESRKKKRLEGEFRNLLRAVQPPIEADSDWSSIRSKIEKEKAFGSVRLFFQFLFFLSAGLGRCS